MSELEKQVRDYVGSYTNKATWWIADVVGCSERTVRRVKQKIREEKEKEVLPIKKITLNLPPLPKPDMVNSPPHYTTGGIETIDYIQAKLTHEEFRGYLKGNCLKYSSRLGHKDAIEQDAGKLAWYANKLNEVL